MTRNILAVCLLVCCVGCMDFVTVQARAPQVGESMAGAIVRAEPVIASLESVTGLGLQEETAGRIEAVSAKVERLSGAVASISAAASAIPGAQPVAGAVGAVAGAVGAVAGGIMAFMQARRRRKTEKALDTALIAGNDAAGFGAAVTRTAAEMGTSDIVAERYQASGAAAADV